MNKYKSLFYIGLAISIFSFSLITATAQSFSDVSINNPYFTAIESLKSNGIIQGYDDGTFKPNQVVNRAEALKMIFTAKKKDGKQYTKSSFPDVPVDAWFFPFVETAKEMKIIKGNPDGTFAPGRNVNKAEFLKMLELGYEVEFVNYALPARPLYKDTTNPSEWYIQYFDFAKNLNLITPDSNGNIKPSSDLTRGEVADIIYKLELVVKGGPAQMLLSRTEAQLLQLMIDLQDDKIEYALQDVANAKNLVNQTLTKYPNENVVKSAVKVVDAFEALTKAYDAVKKGDLDGALTLCGNAYNLSDEAMGISISVQNLANQSKNAAKALADSIRAKKS